MPAEGPARVLITNAEERSMLAACRSLRAAGYEVSAVASRHFAATHASRCCSERLRMTDAQEDAERFVEDLRRQLAGQHYAVLIPGSDMALLAISRWRERLEGLTRIGLPAHASVERSLDREVLAEAAAVAGLSPAESVRCNGLDEAIVAARTLGFPVILKSTRTAYQAGRAVQQAPRSRQVDNEQELAAAISDHDGAVLVQRAERASPLSFGGVIAGERLLGVAVARYRRTWPPEAGNVAFGETIAPPPGLEEKVRQLMVEVGWEGIFELELMQAADDRFTPIDLNPRPYGSMTLAAAAKAPLAAIWCDWLLGRSPQPAHALPGYGYRWEDADLRHLGWQLRRGNFRAAVQTARPRRHVVHAHFRRADPLPLLMRGWYLGWYLTRDRLARLTRSAAKRSADGRDELPPR